ncbi:hypothetical protein [Candidatus Enterovibrio escicola]
MQTAHVSYRFSPRTELFSSVRVSPEADFLHDNAAQNTPLSFLIGQRYIFMVKENPESLFVLQDIGHAFWHTEMLGHVRLFLAKMKGFV